MQRSWVGFLFMLVLLAAGCSTATREGPEPREVTITIENDVMPPAAFSIFALDSTGGRRLIGPVRPGETNTLRFDARGSGDFTFVAEGALGQQIVSYLVTLGDGDAVVWSLNSNVLTPL